MPTKMPVSRHMAEATGAVEVLPRAGATGSGGLTLRLAADLAPGNP